MEWMDTIREKLGLDGVLLLAFGLVAIGVGIYDLLGGAELSSAVLVGVLGAFLVELVLQRSRLGDLKRDMAEMEKRILEGTGLGQALARDDWLSTCIPDLVRAWGEIQSAEQHPFFAEFARRGLQDVHRQVTGVASGVVITDAFDFRCFSVLLQEAQETLKATSLVHQGFWDSPVGRNYWWENKAAIDRGVEIQRIFISDERGDDLMRLMGEMHGAGAAVRYLDMSGLHEDLVRDFAISDERFLMSVTLTPDRMPSSHRVSSRPDELQAAKDRFDQLWLLADKYETLVGQDQRHSRDKAPAPDQELPSQEAAAP